MEFSLLGGKAITNVIDIEVNVSVHESVHQSDALLPQTEFLSHVFNRRNVKKNHSKQCHCHWICH